MDTIKIGKFLKKLREQNNMTQEQLGEKLGVTNKTISRWETGTYLLPIEALQTLSEMYELTINEIISGQQLDELEYKAKAEENIKSALSKSAFTLKEKMDFYQRKWKKEHTFAMTVEMILILGIFIAGFLFDNGLQIVAIIVGFAWAMIQYKKMMTYVKNHAYKECVSSADSHNTPHSNNHTATPDSAPRL